MGILIKGYNRYRQVLVFNFLIIPHANCVCERVYCFHVVRPSERTKVCP